MDYWRECILIAADEAGVELTDEQVDIFAGAVEGGHENYAMAHSHDVASRNYVSDAERKLNELKKEIEDQEKWVLSTKPCKSCTTTGIVLDGWGRDVTCDECGGKGRV